MDTPMNRLTARISGGASLSVRIIAGVLLLLALATALQIYLSNRLARESVLAELQAQLQAKADYSISELRYRLDRLRSDVILLSQLPSVLGIARAAQNGGIDPKEQRDVETLKSRLQDVIIAFTHANPEYFQVRLVGLADGGRELVRVQINNGKTEIVPKEQLQQKQDRDYFIATLALKTGETYLSNFNLNQEFGKIEIPHRRTIRATTPVYSESGEIFAMVVINMDLGPTFDKLLDNNPDYIYTYMFNQNGDYLIHPDKNKTFGFELGAPHRWQDEVRFSTGLPDAQSHRLTLQKLEPFTLENKPLYGLQENFNYEDQGENSRYVSLVYAVDAHYLEVRNEALIRIIVLSALGCAFAIAILLYFYVRRLIAPLVSLSDAAHAIGEGDYSVAMPVQNIPELGQLILAFEIMKEKIAARDREIYEANQHLKTSLEYADLIIESMPEAIIIANPNGEIIRCNRQVATLFGYGTDELIGQPIEVLVPMRDKGGDAAHRASYLKEQISRPMGQGRDLYGLRRDGSEFPVEIGLNTLRSIFGTNVLATVFDITERKRNEAILVHTNTRFSLAASAAGLGFWDYDLVSGLLSWDENMYSIYGVESQTVIQQPYTLWSSSLHPEDRAASEEALQMAIKGDAPFDTEFRIIQPDGALRYVKAQAFVLFDNAGIPRAMYGINLDITERKLAEKRQQKLLRDMSLINEELNSFTYIASHDLKSPLRGIDQLAGWIAEDLAGRIDESTQKHLALMQSRIHRMENLLDDLLEYSRAGRTSSEDVLVDTRLLVQEVCDLSSASKKVHLNIRTTMPVFVTKKVPLEMVLRNLISNAIKHHPSSEEVEIYISATYQNGRFEFGVGDNGAGIAPEHQAKIFLMFQTLKSRDVVEGSGIGLALVKKIVEGLEGKIRVESDGKTGAWFFFTWPGTQLKT
jgi:two-component system, sensor histidine kinase and response regulator